MRKAAWDDLAGHGFRPLLLDRQGTHNFNSGGDSEICFVLRLAGWRLWFEPRLHLRHALEPYRLEWAYLRRLSRGVGASTVGFDPYLRVLAGTRVDCDSATWTCAAVEVLRDLRVRPRPGWREDVGSAAVLDREWRIGRLLELLRQRRSYDRSFDHVRLAPWRHVGSVERAHRSSGRQLDLGTRSTLPRSERGNSVRSEDTGKGSAPA